MSRARVSGALCHLERLEVEGEDQHADFRFGHYKYMILQLECVFPSSR